MDSQKLVQKIISDIESEIGKPCQQLESIIDEHVLQIPSEDLRPVVKVLTKNQGFYHLSTITAQITKDYPDYIEILYHFWKGSGFTILMRLEKENPVIDSIIDYFPGVDFYEREVAEMYGVHFNLRDATPPLLLPDNWTEGPPMLLSEKE